MTLEEELNFEMKDEYDFSNGVRNPYSAQARRLRGEVIVMLAPDLVKAFPDAEAVNEALRSVLKLREAQTAE